ncbi:MAG: hypothetical protein WC928_02535 [Patescibacteria group bacterium]|jgi:dolichol kinase
MFSWRNLFLWRKVDNFSRKIIHILSAIIILFFPYFLSLELIIFVCLLFSFLFALARFFDFLPIINKVRRLSLGEVFYPLGIMISAIFFLPDDILAFQFGVLVLGFSDALANIFGGLFGTYKIKIFGGAKSLEGSLVFLLTTIILSIFFKGDFALLNFDKYFIVALILTLLEFSLFFGLDNLFLPFISAYLFSLL